MYKWKTSFRSGKRRGSLMPEIRLSPRSRYAACLILVSVMKSTWPISGMGPQIQWVQSYVTDDRIYCVYIAPDEDTVRQHAQQGGFPANRISRIRSVIDPTTAE